MTEKLYERDSYIKEFTANVISVIPLKGVSDTEQGTTTFDTFVMELDRTAFFPEGGGQAADTGIIFLADINKSERLESPDSVAHVVDVQIKDGQIYHTVDKEIPVGSKIVGKIDWEIRFSRMQNHTGEHMVSGAIHKRFGFNNVGFHMGKDMITVDVDGKMTPWDVAEIERLVNEQIYESHKIIISFPEAEELEVLEYRSKKELENDVRIVTIEGCDVCACCAPHVARTSEIGLVKILNAYPNKGGTRIEMISGREAFKDYCRIHEYNGEIMKILSSKRDDVAEAVQKSVDALNEARFENKGLKEKLAWARAEIINIGASSLVITKGATFDELRCCSNSILEKSEDICFAFSEVSENEMLYIICSKKTDIRPVAAGINKALNGRGGGKEHYAQGKVAALRQQVEEYIHNNL